MEAVTRIGSASLKEENLDVREFLRDRWRRKNYRGGGGGRTAL